MKCFVCEEVATMKDYADVPFCSTECVAKNWKENIDQVVDYYQSEMKEV